MYFPRQNAQNPGDRFTNAVVSFTDQAVAAEILDVTYILTPPVAALTLFVTAVVPGQPTHVPLVVTDDCGDWPTFVGGGPNAGLTCVRVEAVPSGTEHNSPYIHAGSVGGVHTLTGSFSTSHTDLTSAGVGPTPQLTRTYNSNDPRPGPLGQGWTHNYAAHLARPPDGTQDVVLVGPHGRSDRYSFTGDPNGVYGLPAGVFTTLQRRADGTYLATAPDQSTLTFDACGRLTALADRYGNISTLAYEPSTYRLLRVTDPAGRGSLEFAYDALTGRLRSVTDWIARQVRYEYDPSGRLWKVTDRQGVVTTFGYDGTSMRLATIDDGRSPAIRVLTLAYDAARRVAWTRDALNYQTTFDYGTGNGATVTLPLAAYDPTRAPQVIDAYQAQGWLSTRTTKPTSFETFTVSYTYDAIGNRTSETDANGHTTTYCYDVDYAGQPIPGSRGNLTRKILPAVTAGRTMRPTWLYRYDSRNNLVEEYSPNGVWTDEHVDCATDVRWLLLGNYLVSRQYDERNQLVAVTRQFTDPDLGLQTAITKYEYHATYHGQVVTEIPPRGNTNPNTPDYSYATRHTYYAAPGAQAGMRQDTTDPTGNRTSYTYDAMGRRLTQVEPRGHVAGADPAQYTWTFAYDNEDRLIEEAAPDPNGNTNPPAPLRTRYGYDAVGNRTSVTDARGQITRYVYDAANRLVEVQQSPTHLDPSEDPHRELTRYGYDPLGNLQQVRRQLASDAGPKRLFDYRYDGLGRLRQEIEYPQTGTATWTYTYDGNGNRTRVNKPLGTITYQYDAANRLTAIDYSTTQANPDVLFTYDGSGNRRTMSGSAAGPSAPTTYLYDERDALIQVTFGTLNKTVGYRYDLDGQRRQLIYPNGQRLTYDRDPAGRVRSLSDWATPARTTTYEYWENGRLRRVGNPAPNNTTHRRTYDFAGRLQSVENRFSGGALIGADSYNCEGQSTTCVDPIGNPRTITGWIGRPTGGLASYTITYGYDGLNRLTHFADSDSRSPGVLAATFDYGAPGTPYAGTNNRVKFTANAGETTYTYDGADRMTTVTPPGLPPGTYTYDADGNAYGAPCNLYLSHDLEDRLGTHDDACGHDPVITELRYDAAGLLQEKSRAHTNIYVWDIALPVPQLLEDANLRYVHGPGGLVYATTLDGGSMLYVYHLDGQGSVRALTSGTLAPSTVLFSTSYDPWGVALFQEGALGTGQPFGYTGAVFDPDFQFHYLRARWYNPKSGRFLQRDSVRGALPAPGSLHRYAYAANNPLAYHDPSGHFITPFPGLLDPWWSEPQPPGYPGPVRANLWPDYVSFQFGVSPIFGLAGPYINLTHTSRRAGRARRSPSLASPDPTSI